MRSPSHVIHFISFQVFSKSSSELELVALYPLTVQEGGVSVITTQNIDVILDHHKYGVRPSGVVLHVAQSPQHGRIAIDLSLQRNSQQYNFIEGETKSKQFFTLLDLSRDKVSSSMCSMLKKNWVFVSQSYRLFVIHTEFVYYDKIRQDLRNLRKKRWHIK